MSTQLLPYRQKGLRAGTPADLLPPTNPEMRTAKLDEEEDNIFMSPFCSRHFESFISI